MSDEVSSAQKHKRRVAAGGTTYLANLREDYRLLCRQWLLITLKRGNGQSRSAASSLPKLQSKLMGDTDRVIHSLVRTAARFRRIKSKAMKRDRSLKADDEQGQQKNEKDELDLFKKQLEAQRHFSQMDTTE